jgi:aspartyl-tRNA(Asn)/glutamyl-tRNA(Gln) amidotransferase subunit C
VAFILAGKKHDCSDLLSERSTGLIYYKTALKKGIQMIDRQTVLHIAKLARLGLKDEEIEVMGQQLSVILENIAVLQEVDVSNVSPTAHASRLHNIMREDTPQPSYAPEVLLANAPDQEENCLKVRAVLEEAS